MKNKFYLFLLLCCVWNLNFTETHATPTNEAKPSFTTSEKTNISNIEDLFTDPVINCPGNIVRTAQAGQNSMSVSWSTPSATTPCIISGGQNCPSNNLNGFIYLGKFQGSKYYCSESSNFNYWEAKQKSEQNGGYLAVICSSEENNYIRQGMSNLSNPADVAWIGLNDEANEGHFRWVNGETCGYRNWANGEPNDEHNNNNYHGGDNVILDRHSGKWKDRNGRGKYEFVMEIPCDETTGPGNVTVSQIEGPPSGSSFAVGTTTTIRYRATDECGRSSECSFTVKVNSGGPVDPCQNQGGDSDGDGVCDNQDNCRFVWNADQADNDGDGIGNVCDDTPNGGGGGGDCNSLTVSGADGKINISSIPSGAKLEYQGPSTGYGQVVICEGGSCGSTEMVSGLSAGEYTVTAQTFNPYCYKQYRVTVTGGGGGNPCDGQGGDSDGDGVCDNQDNCRFVWNADQADNDGDGIGNVCDDTPNGGGGGGDCNSLTVSGADGKINISSIPSGAKLEYQGPSTGYGQVVICEGGSCGSSEMVSGLSAGEYTVTAQTFNPYCYKQYRVTVTGGGGGNPCDGQGGDSDGDGVCDNQDNCRFVWNADQADNDGDGIGNVCDDTPNGGGGGGDCNSLTVSGADGKINISSIPSGAKLEYQGPSTGYGQVVICEGGSCGSTEMVSGLSAGEYTVTAQTFNPYCYKQYRVTVTGGGGNPCDGQGGDSDGDGVCDNQDNCRFVWNADQADNDGDGIGNACDDTPNGDPCANQGGDSDGDGVCDNQDNCRFVWNADQADNDGDGIGNACDDTPNGDPCANQGGDSDGDGVCDNQDNCRFVWNADQADNDGDGIGNACDDTPNGGPTVCVMRTATDTRLCTSNNEISRGSEYGGYILLDRNGNSNYLGNFYTIHDGKLTEFSDGTAKFTGRYVNIRRNSARFDIDVTLSQRKRDDNSIHPKEHACGVHQQDDIYYYMQTSGKLRGRGDLEGLVLNVSRTGEPFQIGTGGNITDIDDDFGGSGWLDINIERQANNGSYYLNTGNSGQEGDINIELSGRSSDAFCSAGSRASLSFTAYNASREIALQWATNTTYKNDHYVVEKSTDGETFEELAKVENFENGEDMETFSELDQTPVVGSNYYRLKQVYFDGSFDYSDVKVVDFNIDLESLDAYPNPVKENLFINLKPFTDKQAHILLTNQYGQIVKELDIDKIDNPTFRIDMTNVPNGMYILTVKPGGGLKPISKKLVVGKMY